MSKTISLNINAHENIYVKHSQEDNWGERKLYLEMVIPDAGISENTGMLVLIPGYGGHMSSNIFQKMRKEFSDQYNMVVMQCDYFGNRFMREPQFLEIVKKINNDPQVLDVNLEYQKRIEETQQEFNDMGIMQAVDVVTATLFCLQHIAINEEKMLNTKKIILFGTSHGAYLAHLANIICPRLYSCIIDISSYLLPYYLTYERQWGVETKTKHMKIALQTFLSQHKEFQYNENLYDLRFLYKNMQNSCKIIALQGTQDWMVNYREKERFIQKIGNTAQLMLIREEDVDGVLCKNANHGLGLDFIELFKMLMPMLEKLLKEKSNQINVPELIRVGDETAYFQISYQTFFPKIQHVTFGTEEEKSQNEEIRMSAEELWVEDSIGLCTDYASNEDKKKRAFDKLKERYFALPAEKQRNIRNLLMQRSKPKEAIYLLSCLIYYMKLSDFENDILDMVLTQDYDYYMGTLVEVQILSKVKERYKEKRILHKRNVESFRTLLGKKYPYCPLRERNRKRIVIITEQLLSERHAPTRIIMEFCYNLQQKLGYEVRLFACPCDVNLPEDVWYRPLAKRMIEDLKYLPMEIQYKDTYIEGYQVNMSQASRKEYKMMLDIIHAWNPLFVFQMGVINPMADFVGDFTTVASMGMTSDCPISEADILIRDGQRNEKMEREFADALEKNQVQLFLNNTIPICIEQSESHFTRKELQLPEDKFLITVVGNRLDQEIDDEFVHVMLNILQQNSKAVFVIIGEVMDAKKYFAKEYFDDKIFYLGYCEDLMGVYGVMDLYLNPKRIGGGFSSIMALMAGLPVVTLSDCDVAVGVGGNFCVSNYVEMEAIVNRYVKDKIFYDTQVLLAKEHVQNNTEQEMEKYVSGIVDGVIELIESKEGRE